MQRKLTVILIFMCLAAPASVFAQDSDQQSQINAERQRRLEAERDVQERIKMLDKVADQKLGPSPGFGRSSKGKAERARFYETVPLFREATSRYRESVGIAPSLKTSAKGLEKLISPLREYFNTLKFKRAPVDLSQFENLKPMDLAWETLTMAERVDNNLQLARQYVQLSEREGTISIQTLEFFGQIQDDLNRLKWLTSKVSDVPHFDDR